ncbi:MAG: ABC-2 family transporter protein [Candidatus Melainabacteria bacterium]|nr:ABC-2 family transporter protein [Candidatus Melainabacteria bacterium]
MSFLKKYWAIAWIAGKSNLAYAGEVGSRMFFLTVILYIFMCLWKTTFANAGATNFAGYTPRDIIWYLAFAECIMMSSPRVTPLIDEDVRTGSIAVQLVRPLSYPLYRLASNFGEQVVKFAVTAVAAFLIALLFAGVPENFVTGFLFALLVLPFAFVLDFLGYLLVGLCAFWFEDTTGLALIYSRLTMIAGGMLLPLELFPEQFQVVLRSLPFAYIVNGPARLFVHPDAEALGMVLVNQIVWIAILGLAAAAVFKKALNRIALNGG